VNEAQRLWLADQLLEGAPLDQVEAALCAGGLGSEEALEAIEKILLSPIFRSARPKVQLGQRLAMAAELHLQVCQQNGQVPERQNLSSKDFFEHWLAHHQPVILKGFAANWGALKWSPESIAESLGDEPIEVLTKRQSAKHADRDFRDLITRISPRQWAEMLRSETPQNDLYLVARNHLMQRPQAKALLRDTPIGEAWVSQADLQGCCSLWMGPAKTFTALHHDTCHALFVQLVGRKNFRLASPLIPGLLNDIDPFYHRSKRLLDVCKADEILNAELAPGDALFLPVGWWHEAQSLSLSIGMSFNGLHAANDYEHYCPGRV
jgi:hypothetical protein